MAYSNEVKGLMGVGTLFLLVLTLFVIWQLFQPQWYKNVKAEVTNQPYARTISVSGEGEVNAKPDIAVVNLSVVVQGNTVSQVSNDGNQKMNQVVAAVKALGVEAKDVKTTAYNLRPDYRYPENQKPQISGYTLDQTLTVKMRA